MRFALTGGGTGGHAYPSLAVAERLRARGEDDLVYYGSEHGAERALAEAAGVRFSTLPAAPLRGRSPLRLAGGALALFRGSRAAGRLLAQDRPAALFATGGYVAAPTGRAAGKRGIPLLVFLPDVHPGWAVRFLAHYATRIACSVEASLAHLPAGRTEVTGYPVRGQFGALDRTAARLALGLRPDLPTVLVTGGSLGAQFVNRALAAQLPALLEDAQVCHVSGRADEAWLQREREALPEGLRERYWLRGYTEQMAALMAAADVAVTRAGASTLGELPAAGLPAIVVPGDFSDQHANAAFLADAGAAEVLPQARLAELVPAVRALLHDAPRRAAMAEAMRRLARPDAADRLADLLTEIARPHAGESGAVA